MKKAAAKKPAKKVAAVKAKPAPKKAAPKKVVKKPAKKIAVKTPTKKVAVKKAIAKKSPAKKAVAKKVSKKAPPKKTVAKKVTAKKSVAKKFVAKKAPAKKVVAKKVTTKKPVAKKTVAKKASAKKAPAKKAVAKKSPVTAKVLIAPKGPRYAGPDWPLMNVILDSMEDSKAEEILPINVMGRSSMADGMVIASGRANRHVAAIADQLVDKLKAFGQKDIRVEGLETSDWVLVDAGNIIVHIFRPEVRSFYNLEKLWSEHAPVDSSADQ